MLAYILRRLAQSVLVMLAVGLIAFSLFASSGDPVLFMLGQDSTPEERERVTKMLGLDQRSTSSTRDSSHARCRATSAVAAPGAAGLGLIVERLPATLELSMAAAFSPSLAASRCVTRHCDTIVACAVPARVSLVGVSLPTFLIGILSSSSLGVLGVLPSFGRGDTVSLLVEHGTAHRLGPEVADHARRHARPVQMTLIQRLGAIGDAGSAAHDYIKFARARGSRPRRDFGPRAAATRWCR